MDQVVWKGFIRKIVDHGAGEEEWTLALPSEAQWEYAARAGTETATPFGQQPTDDTVNFARRMGRPNVSGDFSPNAWGLSDVVGNVYEWCSDTSTGGSALQRIARGGSWISSQSQARSASRKRLSIASRADDVGFRICLNTTRALLSDMSTKTAQRPPGV